MHIAQSCIIIQRERAPKQEHVVLEFTLHPTGNDGAHARSGAWRHIFPIIPGRKSLHRLPRSRSLFNSFVIICEQEVSSRRAKHALLHGESQVIVVAATLSASGTTISTALRTRSTSKAVVVLIETALATWADTDVLAARGFRTARKRLSRSIDAPPRQVLSTCCCSCHRVFVPVGRCTALASAPSAGIATAAAPFPALERVSQIVLAALRCLRLADVATAISVSATVSGQTVVAATMGPSP